MARPLRIEFPGAIYHITSRGNAKKNIFLTNEDRAAFLAILASVTKRLGWKCYAYCLMDNHYHLMIEISESNLSHGMRQLNGAYTQKFNFAHRQVGHLFQGRFKSILVERDSYLLELCRYIVLNPVRAGMIKHPQKYFWSSYKSTAGLSPSPDWLDCDSLLDHFSKQRGTARKKYQNFVAEGIKSPSPWLQLKGQILLGSDDFVEKITPLIKVKKPKSEIPKSQRLLDRPGLKEIFRGIKNNKSKRDLAISAAYFKHHYNMMEIAVASDLHYTTISKIISGKR